MSKINDGKTDYSRKRKHGNRSSRAADSAIPRFDIVHLSHVIDILFGRHGDQNTKECRLRGFDRKLVRIVHPYPYTFTTFAKLRWVGRTVLDVYNTEFGSYPKRYYESAIESGRILISGKQVNCTYKIQGGDKLAHTVHRHEPTVALSDSIDHNISDHPPIDIIYEDHSILVVDKPSTLPIHPCGAYHYNTLLEILSDWKPASYGRGKLYTIYRLDQLTSGIVFLAKNAALARSMGKRIVEREGCEKIYLARVKGRFPLDVGHRKNEWQFQYNVSHNGDVNSPPCLNGQFSAEYSNQWKGGVRVSLPLTAQECQEHIRLNRTESCMALGYWLASDKGYVTPQASLHDLHQQIDRLTENEIIMIVTNKKSKEDTNKQPMGDRCKSIYWLNFACPCRVSSQKDGVCEAGSFSHLTDDKERKGIKPAETSFTLVSYDASSDTSVVLAKPITGRTHQIRLHLQQLGHPIANDHCYGGELWYGDRSSKTACEQARAWLNQLDNASPTQSTLSDTPATDMEVYNVVANKQKEHDESATDFIEKTCVWCARCKGAEALSQDCNSDGEETTRALHAAVMKRTLVEYFVRSRGIWLHALQYSLKAVDEDGKEKEVSYKTVLPSWVHASCFTAD